GGRDPLAVEAEGHARDAAGVADQGLTDRLAGGGIPQPHRPVVAGGRDRLAVRAECDAVDAAGVAGQGLADLLAGGGIPQPHRLVAATGGDHLSVAPERHAVDAAGVAAKRQDVVTRAQKPLLKRRPSLTGGRGPQTLKAKKQRQRLLVTVGCRLSSELAGCRQI